MNRGSSLVWVRKRIRRRSCAAGTLTAELFDAGGGLIEIIVYEFAYL